ncbi:MAG: aminotransferase class V-fold PLP-dependent enzyme [Marivibrio sp.]|uniref:pyridoxal phosphate-dependent decarboxylase family protein n=1 Tax=Marivibrio sp. TaxID=2039719 RepID=UPI0032EC2995
MSTTLSPDEVLRAFLSGGWNAGDALAEIGALHACDLAAVSQQAGQFSCWAQAPTALGDDSLATLGRAAAYHFGAKSLFYQAVLPSLDHIADSVLAMTRALADFPQGQPGTLTLGGTESNLLACLAAREAHRRNGRRGRMRPNIVMSQTAHPSFGKAAHLFGMEVRRLPVGAAFTTPAAAFAEHVDADTALIVASAPDYSFGLYDDVADLSTLAVERDVWLHVDAAVGGTLTAPLRTLGEPLPPVDFSSPGIRSISIDLHKHLGAPMGIGALFTRSAADAKLHGYDEDLWPAGPMSSAILNGGRSAGPVAGAYAVLRHLGLAGCREIAATVRKRRRRLQDALREIPGASILGDPRCSTLAVRFDGAEPGQTAAAMASRGWRLNRLKRPPALHFIVDAFPDESVIDALAADLSHAVAAVSRGVRFAELEEARYG